jgi:hypothetical protein
LASPWMRCCAGSGRGLSPARRVGECRTNRNRLRVRITRTVLCRLLQLQPQAPRTLRDA